MVQIYKIEGMTCGGCVANVKRTLENLKVVESADIQLEFPQGRLILKESVEIKDLQEAIGKYQISEIEAPKEEKKTKEIDLPEKSISTYKPLLLIIGFIAGVSILVQYPFEEFSGMLLMRHFMAGFFIIFGFFKLLNLEGFAISYSMYDIVAAKWKGWGYIYPFVEVLLGILFLINVAPVFTNVATILVLGISSIGVIRSVLDQQKIKCACLGDVFNLPMSTVTIVEDLSMISMSAIMLVMM